MPQCGTATRYTTPVVLVPGVRQQAQYVAASSAVQFLLRSTNAQQSPYQVKQKRWPFSSGGENMQAYAAEGSSAFRRSRVQKTFSLSLFFSFLSFFFSFFSSFPFLFFLLLSFFIEEDALIKQDMINEDTDTASDNNRPPEISPSFISRHYITPLIDYYADILIRGFNVSHY